MAEHAEHEHATLEGRTPTRTWKHGEWGGNGGKGSEGKGKGVVVVVVEEEKKEEEDREWRREAAAGTSYRHTHTHGRYYHHSPPLSPIALLLVKVPVPYCYHLLPPRRHSLTRLGPCKRER